MTAQPQWWKLCKLVPRLLVVFFIPRIGQATPPEYTTFDRGQRVDYSPDPDSVLRIWMVYVGQGDGILIQLPTKYNYDANPNDDDSERAEQIEVVVDGGPKSSGEAGARGLADFVAQLYGEVSPKIEHVVITHHDEDHVGGVTRLLTESDLSFGAVHHNGLASYRGGKRNFPSDRRPPNAVVKYDSGMLSRGMAYVNAAKELDSGYLINNLGDLRSARTRGELEGIYDQLAAAVVGNADNGRLASFERAHASHSFIPSVADIEFKVLWPLATLQSYGGNDWGETINGNSVTFRLSYGGFSMVFTGDHNDKSEPELLKALRASQELALLDCDVFKVPHHGSSHADEDFFKRAGFKPVLAVASMGDKGFQSKKIKKNAWQHPATEVIDWLGGPHRVYHTFIHEREFAWDAITSETKRKSMIERSHILVETDGEWFRLVEIPAESGDPAAPPSVAQTRRGNGTRWIKATKP